MRLGMLFARVKTTRRREKSICRPRYKRAGGGSSHSWYVRMRCLFCDSYGQEKDLSIVRARQHDPLAHRVVPSSLSDQADSPVAGWHAVRIHIRIKIVLSVKKKVEDSPAIETRGQ